jgi:hypothetical protein
MNPNVKTQKLTLKTRTIKKLTTGPLPSSHGFSSCSCGCHTRA